MKAATLNVEASKVKDSSPRMSEPAKEDAPADKADQEQAEVKEGDDSASAPQPGVAPRDDTPAATDSQKAKPDEDDTRGDEGSTMQKDDIPPPGQTAPHPPTAVTTDGKQPLFPSNGAMGGATYGMQRMATDMSSNQQLPLTLNQLAIVASSQNKLPVSKVKAIVLRMSRHTESSSQKTSRWYKDDCYVDKNCYSWKNMALFEDYQRHLWTPGGGVRTSYKK